MTKTCGDCGAEFEGVTAEWCKPCRVARSTAAASARRKRDRAAGNEFVVGSRKTRDHGFDTDYLPAREWDV